MTDNLSSFVLPTWRFWRVASEYIITLLVSPISYAGFEETGQIASYQLNLKFRTSYNSFLPEKLLPRRQQAFRRIPFTPVTSRQRPVGRTRRKTVARTPFCSERTIISPQTVNFESMVWNQGLSLSSARVPSQFKSPYKGATSILTPFPVNRTLTFWTCKSMKNHLH